MLYRLNLKLIFKQGLPLFREKQILGSSRYKNLQNQNNEDFLENNAIYRIKCNKDNKTQSLNVTEAFHKIITSSCFSLQIH